MNTETKELHTSEDKNMVKQENKEERASAVRTFSPYTDITESKDCLYVTMDMPGVKKENIDVRLDNDLLEVEGVMDFSPYENLKAAYTEYQIGNYYRRFSIANTVDRDKIEASLADGVLTLTLPKIEEVLPKNIPIT